MVKTPSGENYKTSKFGKGQALRLVNSDIKKMILDRLGPIDRLSTEPLRTGLSRGSLIHLHINMDLSYLYLTEHNSIRYCYYITRVGPDLKPSSIEIYATFHRFNSQLFEGGTILTGYLIDGTGTGERGPEPIFLVEDLWLHNGSKPSVKLEDRIKTINSILDYQYCTDPVVDNYRVVIKDYVEPTYFRSLATEYLSSLSYRNLVDGIVVTAAGRNYFTKNPFSEGLANDIRLNLNLNDEYRHDIINAPTKTKACFLVKPTDKPDVYHLFLAGSGGKLGYYDIAAIPDRESSSYVNNVFKGKDSSAGILMICQYDTRSHIRRWQPILKSNRSSPDNIMFLK